MGGMSGRLRREGRDIFYRFDDGDEARIAMIPDHLTPEEWEQSGGLVVAGDLGVVAEECEGCNWPGRCKAYGSEGCRMKADERLRVESDRG